MVGLQGIARGASGAASPAAITLSFERGFSRAVPVTAVQVAVILAPPLTVRIHKKLSNPTLDQEQIEAELRTLAGHQKILLELDQVLRRIGTERGWSRTRLSAELIELQRRIRQIERRVQMLLIEAAKDDDL
jgi:hypothetical protein